MMLLAVNQNTENFNSPGSSSLFPTPKIREGLKI